MKNHKKIAALLGIGLTTQMGLMAFAALNDAGKYSSVEEAIQNFTGTFYYYSLEGGGFYASTSTTDNGKVWGKATGTASTGETEEDPIPTKPSVDAFFTPTTSSDDEDEVEEEEEEVEVEVVEDVEVVEGVVLSGTTVVVSAEALDVSSVTAALDALLAAEGTSFEVAAAVSESGAVEVVLSADVFTALADAGVDVAIPSDLGSITIPSDSLSSILELVGGEDVAITLAPVAVENLSDAQVEKLAEKTVIEFSLNGLTDFGGAAVDLTVDYETPADVAEEDVVVKAIDEEGETEDMETSFIEKVLNFKATKSAIFFVDVVTAD